MAVPLRQRIAKPRERNDPAANSPAVLGLLKDGVSLDQATAEATTFARRFAAAYPDTNKPFNTGQVQPLLDSFTPRPLRGTLWTMLGFCVGVLLISCVNVMNMQFARERCGSRTGEFGVRMALGAQVTRASSAWCCGRGRPSSRSAWCSDWAWR